MMLIQYEWLYIKYVIFTKLIFIIRNCYIMIIKHFDARQRDHNYGTPG